MRSLFSWSNVLVVLFVLVWLLVIGLAVKVTNDHLQAGRIGWGLLVISMGIFGPPLLLRWRNEQLKALQPQTEGSNPMV